MSQIESQPESLLDPIPAPVQHLDAAALEWRPLLALIAGYAISRVGRESILSLAPSTDSSWINQQHQLIVELRALLDTGVSIALGGLFDPAQLAAKSQILDAALEAEELQSIARLANDIVAWQSLLRNPPAGIRMPVAQEPISDLESGAHPSPIRSSPIQGLIELSAALTQDLKPLAESIQRKLLPDGTLADDASPELSRIRNEQQRQQRVIEESLRSALRRLSASDQTQDETHCFAVE